jgi:ribosomal protein S1
VNVGDQVTVHGRIVQITDRGIIIATAGDLDGLIVVQAENVVPDDALLHDGQAPGE